MQIHRESIYLQYDKQRSQKIADMATEFLNLLAIIHGDQILTGEKSIRDYAQLTMADINSELEIRAKVSKARADRLQQNIKAQMQEQEDSFVNELRSLGI